MKKEEKILAVNNQEDEDFEGYTLYPENAIDDSNMNKRIKKNNPDHKTAEPITDKSHRPTDIFPLTIVRNTDK
ncbi:MAG TPA: hypothetical protein VEV83_11640 [Parafilimonas sp.]|nr:hypothetical protein [Parafilimonas sp.]